MRPSLRRAGAALALSLSMIATSAFSRHNEEPQPFAADDIYMEMNRDIYTLQGCTSDHYGQYIDVRLGVRAKDHGKPEVTPELTAKFAEELREVFSQAVRKHRLEEFLPPDESAYDAVGADVYAFFDRFEQANNGIRLTWSPKHMYLRKHTQDQDCLKKAGLPGSATP